MTTIAHRDTDYLQRVEMRLLRGQTLSPPTRRANADRPAEVTYVRTMRQIAAQFCHKTPQRWPDGSVDRDYLEMRLRMEHKLDLETLDGALDIDECECRRRTDVLRAFVSELAHELV